MATFEELMEQFRTPPETGLPENFAEELQTAYDNDLSVRDAAVSAREQAIADHQKALEAKDAEVLRLKAVNYDLIKAAPKVGEPADNKEPDVDPAKQGVNSLFE